MWRDEDHFEADDAAEISQVFPSIPKILLQRRKYTFQILIKLQIARWMSLDAGTISEIPLRRLRLVGAMQIEKSTEI